MRDLPFCAIIFAHLCLKICQKPSCFEDDAQIGVIIYIILLTDCHFANKTSLTQLACVGKILVLCQLSFRWDFPFLLLFPRNIEELEGQEIETVSKIEYFYQMKNKIRLKNIH